MNFSELAFYLIQIFLPGIIAYKIFEELTHQNDKQNYEVFILSLLFGFISYLFYYVTLWLINLLPFFAFSFHLLETLKDPKNINYGEVFGVSLVAVIVGLIISVLDTYKILHRIARYFGITKKLGDSDIFTHIMNSEVGKEPWALIRDMEDNRAYYGWIHKHSVGKKQNELFLRDVIVYENSSGTEIFRTPSIYLAKPKEKYIIEFPQLNFRDKIDIEEEIDKDIKNEQ